MATDGGCPELNGTIYTPRKGNGKPYSNASFMKLCSTDFSDVILSYRSNDILRVRVESLDQCIQICAKYNLSYRVAMAENVPTPGDSLCQAVSLVKRRRFGLLTSPRKSLANNLPTSRTLLLLEE